MSNQITSVPDKITTARIKLLFSHPFFGNLATRLKVKEASDWLPTAATDGRHLYYNTEFFSKMSIAQIEFVVAHEILHSIFDHMSRREHRNPVLFNIAADYCVNGQLIRDRIGKEPDIKCYHDTKYYGMSAEQVYDLLLDENQDMLESMGSLVDVHIDWSKEDANNPGKPTLTAEEMSGIRDEMIEAVIQAAQTAGNCPAEVARLISQLTEPKMDWRSILRNQIQSLLRNDYTWQRPNRKTMHQGIYLPGTDNDETIDIAIAIDTSGSISNAMLQDFLSEVNGIMNEYQDYKIKIWCFDTAVYNPQEYSSDNGEDLLSYEIKGGGGTDFMANWRFMEDADYVPKKFIFFTDGYPFGDWGIKDYCDTVFMIHGTTEIVAPFGVTIYYDEA